MSSQDVSVVFHPTVDVVGAISKRNDTVSHILQAPTNMVAMIWVAWMAVGAFEWLRMVWFVDKTFQVYGGFSSCVRWWSHLVACS